MVCFVHRSKPSRQVVHVNHNYEALGLQKPAFSNRQEISDQAVSQLNIAENLPLVSSRLPEMPDERLLFFWSFSSFFHVEYPKDNVVAWSATSLTATEYRSIRSPVIFDKSSSQIGEPTKRAQVDVAQTADGLREFVIVARRQLDPELWEIYLPAVIALTISRDESLIASRLDRAEIDARAWEASSPKRTLIALA